MHTFTHDGNAVSNYLHCCRTYKFLCVALSCDRNVLSQKNCKKTLNILEIFLSVNFTSAMCSWVAINIFSRNGNAIISDSYITMVDEKLPMQPWLKQKVNEVFTVIRIPCFSFGL